MQDFDCSILSRDAVWSYGWLSEFRKNVSPLLSGWIEDVRLFEDIFQSNGNHWKTILILCRIQKIKLSFQRHSRCMYADFCAIPPSIRTNLASFIDLHRNVTPLNVIPVPYLIDSFNDYNITVRSTFEETTSLPCIYLQG